MSGRRKSHRIQLSEPEATKPIVDETRSGRRPTMRHKLIHEDEAAIPLTVKPAAKKREPREFSLPLPTED